MLDYSIDYARKHPDWGVVYMSDNHSFSGVSHAVNYKMLGKFILIHDEMYEWNIYFEFDNRTTDNLYGYSYYKFWNVNETPLRNYRCLKDNSAQFE